ncbi:MAG: SMR family transporter [Paraglaciecola sp.]|nr:SMR family transporter [Paraglaciecola sp.]
MSWFILLLAGVCEAGWVLGLKQSDSLSKTPYVALAVISMVLSLYLFTLALRDIAIGHAYIIWVGVGVISISVLNSCFFSEPILKQHYVFYGLILAGVVGLKFS